LKRITVFINMLALLFSSNAYGEAVWVKKEIPESEIAIERMRSIIYVNNIYIVVGTDTNTGRIITSADLDKWTYANTPVCIFLQYSITSFKDKYFSVGSNRWCNSGILVSEDGFNWSINTEHIDLPESLISWGLYGIAGSSQEIIAAGFGVTGTDQVKGLILRSTNGVDWTSQLVSHTDPINVLLNVSYCNGYFFITGDYGRIYKSTNGIQWSKVHEEGIGYLSNVVFGKGKYIVVSEQPGMILTSTDGDSWSHVPYSDASANLLSVEYAQGQFVTTGWKMNGNSPVLRSVDGITWVEEESNVEQPLYAVRFLNGKFIAIGERFNKIDNPNNDNKTVYLVSDPLYFELYVNGDGSCGEKTPCYSTIQAALNVAEATALIKVTGGKYHETPERKTLGTVTISGGWNSTFTEQTGTTEMYAPRATGGGGLKVKPNVKVIAP
jgi:hypothetical protein